MNTQMLQDVTELMAENERLREALKGAAVIANHASAEISRLTAELENARNQLDKKNQALRSISAQCGNVIFNCNQRPADNERHLHSWVAVREFANAAITDEEGC